MIVNNNSNNWSKQSLKHMHEETREEIRASYRTIEKLITRIQEKKKVAESGRDDREKEEAKEAEIDRTSSDRGYRNRRHRDQKTMWQQLVFGTLQPKLGHAVLREELAAWRYRPQRAKTRVKGVACDFDKFTDDEMNAMIGREEECGQTARL